MKSLTPAPHGYSVCTRAMVRFLAAVYLFVGSAPLRAATLVWDSNTGTAGIQDGAGTWSAASTNWSNGVANVSAVATDTVTFGNGGLGAVVNVTGTLTTAGITFGTTTPTGYTLSSSAAGQTITIGASGITMNSGAAATTIGNANLGLILGSAETWTNSSSNLLTVGGTVTGATNNLIVTGTGNTTIGAIQTTTGTLTKSGSGRLTLTGNNTYTGTTLVTAGTLAESGAGSIANTSNLTVNGATAVFDLGANHNDTVGTVTLQGGGRITGTGTSTLTASAGQTFAMQSGTVTAILAGTSIPLNKTTAGTVTLSGANTYTGTTTVTAGTLAESTTGGIANTSNLTINGATAVFDLGANHSDTVGTVTLQGGGSITGTGTSALTASSGRTFALQSGTVSAILAGVGIPLNKTTAGVVTLSAANTYTGPTTITAGNLQVNGSLAAASNVTVGRAGTLSGSGTVNGNTTLTGNGVINFGSTGRIAGTLGVTGGTWAGKGSVTGLVTSSSGMFTIAAGANLTANGDLNITGGSIASNNSTSTITGSVNYTSAASSSFGGIIAGSGKTLTLNNEGGLLILGGTSTYTGATTVTAGTLIVSATGSLSSSSPIFIGPTGTAIFYKPGLSLGAVTNADSLNFFATSGTTTLASLTGAGSTSVTSNLVITGAFDAGTLTINGATASIHTLNGGTVNLANTNLSVSDGNDAGTINGASGQLTKVGAGTLILTGANTYGGGTLVTGGVLQGDATSLQGAITNNAAVVFDQTGTGTYSGAMTGSGSLTKQGSGTLILTGANAFTGGTTVSAGVLQGNTTSLQGAILNNASVVFDQTVNGTYAGVMSGSGSLTKQGAGTLFLTGTNTYSGGTTVSAGILRGNTSSLQGAIVNNASVIFDQSGIGTYSGTMSGTGILTKENVGTLILSGNNTYSGGTFINAGVIRTTNANALGTGPVTLNGGSLDSQGPLTLSALTLTSGSTVTLTNTLTLTSGSLKQTGTAARIIGGTLQAAQFSIDTQGTLTLDSNLFSLGGLTKTGAGTLVFNGQGTLGGEVEIRAGTFVLDGALRTPNLEILPGSLLTGTGVLYGNLVNAGTVNPGHSPGKLTVHGNYRQTSSGTLILEVQSPTVHDQLVISGTAKLSGTLDVRDYGKHHFVYGDVVPDFLTARRITGRFQQVLMPSANLRGRIVNDGQSLTLIAAPASYTLVAHTADERSLAKALDHWIGNERGDVATATLGLDVLRANQYPQAFAAISPIAYSVLPRVGIEQSISQNQLLGHRMSELRAGFTKAPSDIKQPPPAKKKRHRKGNSAKEVADVKDSFEAVSEVSPPRWGTFAQLTGQFAGVDSLQQLADSHFNSLGVLVGIDYRLNNRAAVGLSIGNDYTLLDLDHGGRITTESGRLTGYSTVGFDHGFFINSTLGGGWSNFDVKRSVRYGFIDRIARGSMDGGQFFTSVEVGNDIKLGKWTLTPSTGFQYTYYNVNGVTETQADALALKIESFHAESLRFNAGVSLAYHTKIGNKVKLAPYVQASWQHEFIDQPEEIRAALPADGGTFFTHGSSLQQDRVLAGLGVLVELSDTSTLNLGYQTDFGAGDYHSHLIFLQWSVKF